MLAWVFGSLWMWTISGAAMTQFAKGLGMPDWGFGLLATLPFVGTLFQLPGSWVHERFGRRKAWFISTHLFSRLLWIGIALIPWIVPESLGGARWGVLLVMVCLSWVSMSLSTPAFMSWFSDLVPRRIRGRHLALRNSATLPLSLVASLGVGWWLYRAELAAGADIADELLRLTSLIVGCAGIFGSLDILCFFWVKDPVPSRGNPHTPWLSMLKTPLRDANFRRFLAYNATLMLAIGFLGQYVWLFVLYEARVSFLQANLMLLAVPLVIRAMAYPFWGRLVDRLGKKPVMLISGSLFVFGPVGWLLVTPELIWPGYLMTLISPFAFPGLECANMNFILGLAETRKGRSGGSAYVAVNSIVVGVAGVTSGLIGAVVAKSLDAFHYEWVVSWTWMAWWVQEAGPAVVVTYHGVLFLISMGLRVAALIWAATLVEPRAIGTRQALRIVTSSLYSNMRQGAALPVRLLTGRKPVRN